MGFRDIPQPFVCGVLVDDSTVDGVTRTMKLAEYEGADVFDFELQSLDPELRNPAAVRPVFEATTRPIFTVYRRYGMRGSTLVYGENDEETRTQLQLELIDVGSLGFDLELDTFDPHVEPLSNTPEGKRYSFDRSSPPREISTEPRAVERQLRLIDDAHRRGGEVMASAHTLTRMTPEQALWIGNAGER